MEEMTKPSVLVTGGTGFIGSHLLRAIVAKGWTVTSCSLHEPSRERQVDGVEYEICDIANTTNVCKLVKDGFDYVVNLSGYVDHSKFYNGGEPIIDHHFGGVLNLAKCLPQKKLKRFIQIGSSDEYGDLPAPQNEVMRESPISTYSLAKVAATQFLQMMYRTEGFPATVLRLFLVYGPGQGGQRFIPQVIQGCLQNSSFPVSSGQQIRDFCYVGDVVSGIMAAIDAPGLNGSVLNIASGIPISIRYVVERVRELVKKGDPRFGQIPYREGESMSLYADVSKALKLLKWKPECSIDDGLINTIEWYLGYYDA